jgi:hypothetical protein
MSAEMMQEILGMIEAEAHSRPAPFEYELAYQARVAIDRLRFAIKHTEQFCDTIRAAARSRIAIAGRVTTPRNGRPPLSGALTDDSPVACLPS